MEIRDMIIMVLAIFGILLLMLSLHGVAGQGIDWNTVSSSTAPFIVMLMAFGIGLYVVMRR